MSKPIMSTICTSVQLLKDIENNSSLRWTQDLLPSEYTPYESPFVLSVQDGTLRHNIENRAFERTQLSNEDFRSECSTLYPKGTLIAIQVTLRVPEGYPYVSIDEGGTPFCFTEDPRAIKPEKCDGEFIARGEIEQLKVVNWRDTLTRVPTKEG